jgi:hypothetical protein
MTAAHGGTGGAGAIEIRPVPRPGQQLPADRATLRKWVLRANPADGTLVFTEDRPGLITPVRSLTFALPATGRPDAVRTVCLADYRWEKNVPESYRRRGLADGITWRLLFLDREGRVLGAGRRRDEPKASQMWPPEAFTPLQSLGISVTQEHYATEEAFRQAHRGAA